MAKQSNDSIRNLVSNPVFLSIQGNIQEGAETNSQILYANQYSGLSEVAMSGELLELFQDNNLNLTDTNFRLQLQHLMEEFDAESGPWYIEGHNGVIHIHNRKIAQSAFVYRYQDENGEVLKVQITTNWTTGSSSGTVASVISNNKERNITRVDLPELDFTTPDEKGVNRRPIRHWLTPDNTRVAGTEHSWETVWRDEEGRIVHKGKGVESDAWRASQALNAGAELTPLPTPEETWRAEYIQYRQKYNARQAKNREVLSEKGSSVRDNEVLTRNISNPDTIIDQWQQDIRDEFIKHGGAGSPEMGAEYARVYDKIYHGEVLTPAEQRLANTRIWLDDPKLLAQMGTVETKRDLTYSGKGHQRASGGYDTYGTYGSWGGSWSPVGKGGTIVSAVTIEELEQRLVAAGVGVKQTLNKGLWGSSSWTVAPYDIMATVKQDIKAAQQRGGGAFNTTIGGITVTIKNDGSYTVKVKVAGNFPGTTTMMGAATWAAKRDTPGVGGSKRARALALVNKMRNRAKKAKHKEIEVQMVVVGRPSLEAGQYIDILNIGQKYSGQWYIKTCIHQLDSNGYTCSLTLKRNQRTPNGRAVSTSRKRDGSTTGATYEVHTSKGIVTLNLSAADTAYLNRLALEGKQKSFNTFVRTAVHAQQQGTYGEGLKQPTNLQDVHMDGRENPDLTYEDTPAGKAAAKAYSAEVERQRAQAKLSQNKLSSKKKK